MTGIERVIRAQYFATGAHTAVKQLRKYTNEPYIVHPAEVVDILREHGIEDEFMLSAAWMHDVVEDTGVEIVDIWREFGSVVASYVNWLTNPSKPEDGNRAERKRIDREYIRNAPPEVHSIKCADLISNTSTIVEYDPDFAQVYLEEKRLMLEVLTGAEPTLLARAREIISLDK